MHLLIRIVNVCAIGYEYGIMLASFCVLAAATNSGKPFKSQLHEFFQKYPGGGNLRFQVQKIHLLPNKLKS